MYEKEWYYVEDEKQIGPLSETEVKELFRIGSLDGKTLVWSKSMINWLPASEIKTFKFIDSSTLPPLPHQTTIPEDNNLQVNGGVKVRPWVRFWARGIDIIIFSYIAGIVIGILHPSAMYVNDYIFSFFVFLSWVIIEAYLLSTWGFTPGKWLLRIKIRGVNGSKVEFNNAIKRSFTVWWRGLGASLPIISFITMVIAYRDLKKNGISIWDIENATVVSHEDVGTIRAVLVTLIFFLHSLIFFLV